MDYKNLVISFITLTLTSSIAFAQGNPYPNGKSPSDASEIKVTAVKYPEAEPTSRIPDIKPGTPIRFFDDQKAVKNSVINSYQKYILARLAYNIKGIPKVTLSRGMSGIVTQNQCGEENLHDGLALVPYAICKLVVQVDGVEYVIFRSEVLQRENKNQFAQMTQDIPITEDNSVEAILNAQGEYGLVEEESAVAN